MFLSTVYISLHIKLHRFSSHSFLAKYSTEITTFGESRAKRTSKNYELTVANFRATDGKNLCFGRYAYTRSARRPNTKKNSE